MQVRASSNYPARRIALSAAQNWGSTHWSSMQQQQTWQPQQPQRVSHLSQQALFDLVSRHTAVTPMTSAGEVYSAGLSRKCSMSSSFKD